MKPISCFVLALTFSLALSHTASAQKRKDSVKWNTHKTDGFEVSYPDTWSFDTSGAMGSSFFAFSQLTSSKDTFKENVNLLVQDLSAQPNLTLAKFAALSEKQVKQLIVDSKLLVSKRVKGGDLPYHHFIYTGKQGNFDIRFEQMCWVIDKKAYILTLTCEQKEFKTHQVTGQKILKSFKLKD